MKKSKNKKILTPEVAERLKRVSYLVHQEGKRVIDLLKRKPSNNEIKLKQLLEDNSIKFTFLKILYQDLEGNKDYAGKYYIAQFWLHKKKLFIEVDSYRRVLPISTDFRVFDSTDVYPKAQCMKLSEEDINNSEFMEGLLNTLK